VIECPTCGKTILEDSDRRVPWLAWAYSHSPRWDTLCQCNGVPPRSTRTEFPEYPLEQRLADLRRGEKPLRPPKQGTTAKEKKAKHLNFKRTRGGRHRSLTAEDEWIN
jgi:hypothetical protein